MTPEPNTSTETEKNTFSLIMVLFIIGFGILVLGLNQYIDGYSETYGGWRSNDLEKVVISAYVLNDKNEALGTICAQGIIDENINCLIYPCYGKLSHIEKNMPIGSTMLINFSLYSGNPCITTHLVKNNSFYGLIFIIIAISLFIFPPMMCCCLGCYNSYQKSRTVRYTTVNLEMV